MHLKMSSAKWRSVDSAKIFQYVEVCIFSCPVLIEWLEAPIHPLNHRSFIGRSHWLVRKTAALNYFKSVKWLSVTCMCFCTWQCNAFGPNSDNSDGMLITNQLFYRRKGFFLHKIYPKIKIQSESLVNYVNIRIDISTKVDYFAVIAC